MRKKIFLPILVLIVVVALSGCKKKAEPVIEPIPAPVVVEPVVEANEDEKEVIMNDFEDLIESDSKLEEIVSYINEKINKLSQLEGDRMIDELEKKMTANIEDLTNRLFATDKDGELMAIAGTEKYFPENKIGEIKDAKLKEEIQNTFNNMYRLINLEGEFYPLVDYTKLKTYNNNISDEWKEYLSVRAMDSDNEPFADGGLTITFEDLANRIIKTENFLNKYIAGPRQEELIKLYEYKLAAYMKGLPNTPIADYSSKIIFDEIMDSYEATASMEGYITAHLMYQYVEDIKANKLVIDNGLLAKADEYITEALRMLREYK